MTTVLVIIIGIVFGAVAYLVCGVNCALVSLYLWDKGDNDGLLPFLFFPINYCRRTIGDFNEGEALPNLCQLAASGISMVITVSYVILTILFWPLRLVLPALTAPYLVARAVVTWSRDRLLGRPDER
jgi:hypothetical protein